ncbi:glycosyltransferase [Secundilactobacillus silagei]|uniref:glycosyltransferase n=1 Tax=Secundilactobacillus silagei TaxID=1293415 RepID=UPI001CDA68D3|nr:glycosyltransferase [Secundilactobacillus silagei]
MHVLEVFGEPISFGGQESFVFNNIKAMNLQGLKFDFLTPYYIDNENYSQFIKKIDGHLFSFNLGFNPGKSRLNIIKHFDSFLTDHFYDVIHIHSGSISVLGICAAIAKKHQINRIIVHSHMAGVNESFKHRILKKLINPIFKKCATDFCAPTKVAGNWQFGQSLTKNRLHIIKNGIDLSKFSYNHSVRIQMRKKLNISNETLLIGDVGRLTSDKNQMFLFEIFCELKRIQNNSKIILVGSGNKYKKELQSVAKKHHFDIDVIYTGNVNNVNDYMQAMDVFVFPSKFEGLGIVTIEAQSMGLPVIVSTRVPKDVKLTKKVKFLNLSDPPFKWANEIVQCNQHVRDTSEMTIRQAGYDIRETAEILRNLYIL